jgi:hypothetical protein
MPAHTWRGWVRRRMQAILQDWAPVDHHTPADHEPSIRVDGSLCCLWDSVHGFVVTPPARRPFLVPRDVHIIDDCQARSGHVLLARPWSPALTHRNHLANCHDRQGRGQTGPAQTLLVNSRRSISNAMGMNVTKGIYSVSLVFQHRM